MGTESPGYNLTAASPLGRPHSLFQGESSRRHRGHDSPKAAGPAAQQSRRKEVTAQQRPLPVSLRVKARWSL